MIVVGSRTATIDKQVLENAEARSPENTAGTSFRWWCEQVLKSGVLS